jgi:hypothetical protein
MSIAGTVAKDLEPVGIGFVAPQAVGLGAEPQVAVSRNQDHPNEGARLPCGLALGPWRRGVEPVPVVTHEASPGAQPKQSTAVLCQRRHDVLRDESRATDGVELRFVQIGRARGCNGRTVQQCSRGGQG